MNLHNESQEQIQIHPDTVSETEKAFDILLAVLIVLIVTIPPIAVWTNQIKMFAYAKLLLIRILVVTAFAVMVIKKLELGQLFFRKNPLNIPVFLVNLTFFISVFRGKSLYLAVLDYSNILFYSLAFFIIVNTVKNYVELSWLLNLIISVGFTAAFYGFCQSLGWDPMFGDIGASGRFRVFSFYGNPDFLAQFLILIAPVIAYKILESDLLGKIIYSVILCPFVWVLLATYTRSSWVALGVASMFILVNFALLGWKLGGKYVTLSKRFFMTLVSLVVLGLIFLYSVNLINGYYLGKKYDSAEKDYQNALQAGNSNAVALKDVANQAKNAFEAHKKSDLFKQYMLRFVSIFDLTHVHTRQRFMLWHVSLLMALEHPIVGVGIGNWKQNYFDYQKKFFEKKGSEIFYDVAASPLRAHNEYLQFLAEGGVLGLSAFLLMIFVLFYSELRIVYTTKVYNRQVFIVFMLASLVALLTQCMFTFPFHRPAASLYFFLYMAILMVENILWNKETYPSRVRYFHGSETGGLFVRLVQGAILVIAYLCIHYSSSIFIANTYVKEGMKIAAEQPPYSALSEGVEKAYIESLKLDPNYGETHFRLAQHYQARAEYFANPQVQDEMLRTKRFTAEQLKNIVIEHYEKSLLSYNASLLTVDSRFTYFYAGIVYQQLAELKNDKTLFLKAFSLYDYIALVMPNYTKAQYNLGVICYRIVELFKGELTKEEEEQYLQRAYNAWKSAISYSSEKTIEARRTMPEFERAFFNLAIFHFNRSEYPPAKNYFKKTLEINPRNPEVKKYLDLIQNSVIQLISNARQAYERKNFEVSKKYFDRALELDPGNPDVRKYIKEYFPAEKDRPKN